jgi:hypothetical protein
MIKKALLFGIIILFIGISIASSASYKNEKVNDEPITSFETLSEDNNNEILTKIFGHCYDYDIHNGLFIRNITFWGGGSCIEVKGWIQPFPTFFEKRVTVVHAPVYIGTIYEYPWGDSYSINGLAIGSIKWSM